MAITSVDTVNKSITPEIASQTLYLCMLYILYMHLLIHLLYCIIFCVMLTPSCGGKKATTDGTQECPPI